MSSPAAKIALGLGVVACCCILGVLVESPMTSARAESPPAPPPVPRCQEAISRETTERLFAILNQPLSETDCAFEGVATNRTNLQARWSRAGISLPPISVTPRACAPESLQSKGNFVIDVPRQLTESCPSVGRLIAQFERQLADEEFSADAAPADAPLFRAAQVLFLVAILATLGLMLRGTYRLAGLDRGWLLVGISGFAAAVLVRAVLPLSLGNWYSEVLPATGAPPWMRFGPGLFAFQSLLRGMGVWNIQTLSITQIVLGAAAVPLLLGVMWELRFGLGAAAATLVLLIFNPFHARLSATSSEHVLAATLCLALLLCWLRAAARRDWLWFFVALPLFTLVCFTRVDMTLQAVVVLGWPLLRDAVDRDGRRGWPPPAMLSLLAVWTVTTLALVYRLVVLPSFHPTPDWPAHAFALRQFLPQFWLMATNDPPWLSLSAVVLAVPGAVMLAIRRPLLCIRIAATLLVAFVALGRSFMHDELVGARYFLFAIAIFLMVPGYAFEVALGMVPRPARMLAGAVGLAGLALWTGLAARSAYATRYAFEDEYAFARDALTHLPAGCAVYQIRIRSDALPHDVDCCLDLRRSPLVLEFPQLRFVDLPEQRATPFADTECAAYYEGVACEIRPGSPDRLGYEFATTSAEYFRTRCEAVRRGGKLDLIAETTTSPRTTEGFFDARRPRIRLYQWHARQETNANAGLPPGGR